MLGRRPSKVLYDTMRRWVFFKVLAWASRENYDGSMPYCRTFRNIPSISFSIPAGDALYLTSVNGGWFLATKKPVPALLVLPRGV